MARWQFEVADWTDVDAKDKAIAARDAQADALKQTLEKRDTDAFQRISDFVDGLLTAASVTSDWTVGLYASSDVLSDESFTMNLSMRATPPLP